MAMRHGASISKATLTLALATKVSLPFLNWDKPTPEPWGICADVARAAASAS